MEKRHLFSGETQSFLLVSRRHAWLHVITGGFIINSMTPIQSVQLTKEPQAWINGSISRIN